MKVVGWQRLLEGWPWFHGAGSYPIAAYSEFLPPPRLGRRPGGETDAFLFEPDDPWGWYVTEYEELLELRPGLNHVASSLLKAVRNLAAGRPAPGSRGSSIGATRAGLPTWTSRPASAARALRPAVAAGPVAHPGRQGPGALDRVRLQRAGPGSRLLARFLHRAGPGMARRKVAGVHPPVARGSVRQSAPSSWPTCTKPASACCR